MKTSGSRLNIKLLLLCFICMPALLVIYSVCSLIMQPQHVIDKHTNKELGKNHKKLPTVSQRKITYQLTSFVNFTHFTDNQRQCLDNKNINIFNITINQTVPHLTNSKCIFKDENKVYYSDYASTQS